MTRNNLSVILISLSSWLKSLGLKSLGLESSWLKSPGLKGLGLKLGVEKPGVEMSFNLHFHLLFADVDSKDAQNANYHIEHKGFCFVTKTF